MRKQGFVGVGGVVALAGLAAVFGMKGIAAPAVAQTKQPVRMQSHYDEKRGVNYTVSHEIDGGRRITGESADLQFAKTTYQDGHFTLQLTSGDDVVSFAVGQLGVDVTRGKRAVRIESGAQEQPLEQARALLSGSRAVRRFRQLAAILEQSDENTPDVHATLLGASIVHALDGDPGAIARIAKRLTRKTAQAQAGTGLKRAAFYEDCWETYNYQVNAAWNDYGLCMSPATWVTYDYYNAGCGFIWTIRAEGAWWQYLGCSAIPIR